MTQGTIIRTICLGLALVNQVLAIFGKSPLPFTDDFIELFVSTVWTLVSAVWAWWKNNSITKEAVLGDDFMHELKARRGYEE